MKRTLKILTQIHRNVVNDTSDTQICSYTSNILLFIFGRTAQRNGTALYTAVRLQRICTTSFTLATTFQ